MRKGISYYRKVLQWKQKHKLPEQDITIETENGLLSVSNKDWLIGKHLFVHRNYEIDFIEKAIGFLQSEGLLKEGVNNIVVDVGANIGMICIALVKKGFFRKALAFEPSPNTFRLLQKNVSQNAFEEKIRCFNYALSSENTRMKLELAIGNSGDNRIKFSDESGKMKEQRREEVEVQTRTFDSIFLEYHSLEAGNIDLLWLDIQGHEGHFLKGASEFFSRRKIPCISEFWGYGIKRAGMTEEEYCRVAGQIFTKFYLWDKAGFQPKKITDLKDLFEKNENPRNIYSVIFI
jgi:FkbM family methyltransferase